MNDKLKIFECIATDKGLIFTVETKTKGYVVLKYHSALNIVTVNYSPLEYKNASTLTDKEDKIFEETKKSFLKYLRDNLKTPYAQKVLDYLKAVELAKNGRPAYKS